MTKITEEMIEACYNAYMTDGDIEQAVQLGMNTNSAKMTLDWFEKIFSGDLYSSNVSNLQINWILNRLYDDKDFERLTKVLKSLDEYCLDSADKPIIKTKHLIKEFKEKVKCLTG